MTEWYVFGTLLRIAPGELDGIPISYPREGVQYWKIKMFRIWLRSDPNASWKDVVRALEKAKHFSLAAKLKRKYLLSLPAGNQKGTHTHPNAGYTGYRRVGVAYAKL